MEKSELKFILSVNREMFVDLIGELIFQFFFFSFLNGSQFWLFIKLILDVIQFSFCMEIKSMRISTFETQNTLFNLIVFFYLFRPISPHDVKHLNLNQSIKAKTIIQMNRFESRLYLQ